VLFNCCHRLLQTKEGVYGGVCEYELICETTPPRPLPFPPCVHTSWGPGDSAAKYCLVPLQSGAIFCTVNGLAEVRFEMPKELRFTAKVKSNDRDEKALAGYIMNRVVSNRSVFTFRSACDGSLYRETQKTEQLASVSQKGVSVLLQITSPNANRLLKFLVTGYHTKGIYT